MSSSTKAKPKTDTTEIIPTPDSTSESTEKTQVAKSKDSHSKTEEIKESASKTTKLEHSLAKIRENIVEIAEKSDSIGSHGKGHKKIDSDIDNATVETTEEAETEPKSFPIEEVKLDDDEPDSDSSLKEVEFSVEYTTNFGEKIALVGSSPELGAWDLEKAVELLWNEPNVWKTKVNVSKSPLEYKYIFVSTDSTAWEGGKNRSLAAEVLTTKDSWQ